MQSRIHAQVRLNLAIGDCDRARLYWPQHVRTGGPINLQGLARYRGCPECVRGRAPYEKKPLLVLSCVVGMASVIGTTNQQITIKMRNSILKFGLMTLLAAAVAVAPAQLQAQTTNKHAATKKPAAEKTDATAKKGHPFHGRLAAVDKAAKTITIGKSTYYITSDTKIKKADKPATLEDGVVGEEVGGYAKPGDGGKMVASSLTLGPKTVGKPAG